MKNNLVTIFLLFSLALSAWSIATSPQPTDLSFRQWLFEYIPTQYPDAKMIDHQYWLQGYITDDLVANWTEWTDEDSTLKAMEAHNLTPGKAMFIEQKGPKKDWTDHPSVTYYENAGYYISGYDPATMSGWDGKGLSVIQFDGDAKELAQMIAMAWARENSFESWLYQYLPVRYPNARMTDHGKWKQAHITEHIVASWEQWDVKDVNLKALEKESLAQGKAFFIEKGEKTDWANHPAVTYFEGAGYYCSGYDQATMRNWGVEGLTLIQFDGDCKELARTIAKAWVEAKPKASNEEADISNDDTVKSDGNNALLKVSTVKLDGINTFKVETAMGTFHWECDPGKSGWMSAFDNNGKDWISAGPRQRGVGNHSDFRGLPNSGADDWGHPSRNWNHKKANVTSKIIGSTEGDKIIIESEGNTIKARWHCFNTHIAMEIVELKSGKYHFLWEGTPGGTIHTEEGVITADGKTRKIKEGWFAETPDWPAGENGEWFIITDPNKKYNMWMAQTPATNDKGELWYQKGNMDLASFGRPDNKPTFTDTDRKFAWGFIPYKWDFETAKKHIETILKNPLQQKKPIVAAPDKSKSKKLRVIMMSDFPPIGVVKGGNVPNNQKSDPDDMQSMVRFLLYANEFDVEGLVATAGTFAMEAHKQHMLDVLDRYEMVYKNLKSHDSDYPTPEYLRSVTYEGLGNNHGLSIKWGRNQQPYTDIIGKGKDSEASNAIIAAADKPDPRPLWIGVWGGPREVAQAIWDVRNTRSEEEFKTFLSKLRIFLIAYQDATHGWLMDEFPDLFIIDSRKTYQGMFGGHDPISNLAWVNENIRNNHGPLCDVYPHEGMGCTGVCEGDSPSFLYLVSANRGINDPEDPTQPSWGGQYKRKPNTNHYVDGPGGSSISRWRKDYQEEFAKRANWCIEWAPTDKPETETQFSNWLKEYIPGKYQGSTFDHHGDWYQIFIPEYDLTVSWGFAPQSKLALKEVEGLSENKSIFIAKEDKEDWDDVSKINYSPNVGYYISEYISSAMGDFEVGQVTVVQFDGKPEKFVDKMVKAYGKNPDKSELEFMYWLKEYVNAEYPALKVDYHGAWYQSVIPQFDLTVTWGTMATSQMTLKELHGVREDKSIFIEKETNEGWETLPTVDYTKGVGYYISKYNASSMGDFEVGKLCVVQFDGDAKEFTEKMAKAWQSASFTGNNERYKPRVIHTTDLGADPDDEQSMVRYLVCSNEFDTEGLIVATGCWKKNQSNTAMLDKLVDAYAEVYDNLKNHADGYPTPEYLKSISVMGQRGYGMGDVGDGKDSPGSEMIIAAVDKDDPRPVWVGGWGGVNNVAQAVWKVQNTRSEAELAEFISKLRVFDILGQDDAGAWLAKNFPDLFYIRATSVYGWQPPKNGDYQKNIQSHGPLGAAYPNTKWATEGDTPAYMHIYPNGLNDPDQIDQGGWGGRFSFTKKTNIRSMSGVTKIRGDGETRYDPYYMYGNTSEGAGAIKRWSKGYNNDFQARMDWTMTSKYSEVNHHPIAVVNGDTTRQVLKVSAAPGSSVTLSAAGSSDPDGDTLIYSWSFYKDPSSYSGDVTIQNGSSVSPTVVIPSNAGGKTMHIILELRDIGTPNLYAYRRVIINVQ